ncbi:MAG: glycerol-3-phosphate dehydrogenase [Gemmataceae bacterium]|nr:glycerol-3-phosphate dehydrogenase [Gemmataceae bacterium]
MKRSLDALRDETFDVLVLGGGITGAGIALDCALRGFRTALIDKGDFASGTSSVSSKLVHGGLRYLEHGDFHLVYEALHERRNLVENAPHIVHPLQFIIPFYRGSRVPPWKWRIGLTLYDLLAGSSNLHRSHPVPLSRLQHDFGGLRRDGLHGGGSYFDAQMDDARLCIDVLKTAAEQGAVLANYVEATAFDRSGGAVTGVRAIDRLHGIELPIRVRQIVNATGPWVDAMCRLAGDETGPYLRPTKGVHVVVPDRGLKAAFLMLHPADGRVFFVIPWLGKTLIGTTDTFGDDHPDSLKVAPRDVAYLLEGHNHFFAPALQSGDVLGSFVGLRPLLHSRAGEPAAVSREARIIQSPSGLVSVAGGKYTTYRRMAQDVTDVVARRLGSRRRCSTQRFRLDGAPAEPWADYAPQAVRQLSGQRGLSKAAAHHLVHRYGRRAFDVASYLDREPGLVEPVAKGEPELRVEFVYHRLHEMAQTPADSLLRRTRLGLFQPELLRSETEQSLGLREVNS